MFEELQANCEPPPPRENKANSWISMATWRLVDHRAMLQRRGMMGLSAKQKLDRQVKALLKADRLKRASTAASTMEGFLAARDLKEAWRVLKDWYATASDRAPKPCYESMAKQTKEREELYTEIPPPGDSIPIHVEPFDLNDEVPEEVEIRAVVAKMRNGRAGGSGGIRAEHIKDWLRGMKEEEIEGREKAGDLWRLFVRLIQSIWRTGSIPRQMLWMVVVLLPKGGGDFRGIGLI